MNLPASSRNWDPASRLRDGPSATAWWWRIARRAGPVFIVVPARKICARFFVSQRCFRGIHCCAGAARPKHLLQLKPETAFRDDALTEPPACVVQGVEDLKLHAG